MKKVLLPYLTLAMTLFSLPAFSQSESDTASLGLPGDNLDLYAVMDIFQKSKTIEDFEKSLNDDKKRINNLDLDNDNKVDFIKVVTNKKDESYSFILRVDVSKTESQDVAVILVDRDKNKKVTMQIVGDETLYGKDYVIEPATKSNTPTANPGYTGADPVVVNVQQPTTTVVVETVPIVQYVYSPAYVPYVPPYYYGFPPPWFAMGACIAVGIYRHNNWYHHSHYHGGHYHGGGNTVVINNRNNYNNYNNNKMRSNTVNNNVRNNQYNNVGNNNRASASNRQSGNRASTSNRQSPSASNRAGTGPSASNRQSPSTSNRASTGPSTTNRASTGSSSRPSSSSMNSGRTRSSGGFSGGGASRPSGGGGAARAGGGGRRR